MVKKFDLIIFTVPVDLDWNKYFGFLKCEWTMVFLGVLLKALQASATSFIFGRYSLVGSLIGGIRETQEMLDFCGKYNIVSDIEIRPIDKAQETYELVAKGDVCFRFVIDMTSLK